MEKKDKALNRRLCEPEDEDARSEGIFEEEIIDIKKRCLILAPKKKLEPDRSPKKCKNKART